VKNVCVCFDEICVRHSERRKRIMDDQYNCDREINITLEREREKDREKHKERIIIHV